MLLKIWGFIVMLNGIFYYDVYTYQNSTQNFQSLHFMPWKRSSCRGDKHWKPDKEILDQVLFVSAACGWLRESKGLNQETPALKLCHPSWALRLVCFTLLVGKSLCSSGVHTYQVCKLCRLLPAVVCICHHPNHAVSWIKYTVQLQVLNH